MRFVIIEASECNKDLGEYANINKISAKVHLDCDSQIALETLVEEFGAKSINYARKFQFYSPKSFAACTTGTGKDPISHHVIPYLLDQNDRFTTVRQNSTIGGMFVLREDITIIQNYIAKAFPEAEIIDNVTIIEKTALERMHFVD